MTIKSDTGHSSRAVKHNEIRSRVDAAIKATLTLRGAIIRVDNYDDLYDFSRQLNLVKEGGRWNLYEEGEVVGFMYNRQFLTLYCLYRDVLKVTESCRYNLSDNNFRRVYAYEQVKTLVASYLFKP